MQRVSFDELKLAGSLPSPTGVGLAILRLTKREDFVLGPLARTIQSDPALTGRILELANANLAAGQPAVISVEDAVMQLSVGTVRSVALGFSLVSANRAGEVRGFDYDAYWSQTLINAIAVRFLSVEHGDVPPAAAFTCAMLSGIGRLALAAAHPEPYAEVVKKSRELDSEGLLELERRDLGLDHAELGSAMLSDWKLPESMVYAVRAFERKPGTLTPPSDEAAAMELALRRATHLSDALLSGESFKSTSWSQRGDTAFLARELAVAPAVVLRLRDRVLEEWHEWSRLLEVQSTPPPADVLGETAVRRKQEAASRRGLRILAVDDDPVTLRLLRAQLGLDGHAITTATNGAEALAIALRSQPQMVVTDLSMPEMDGLELCRALRASNVCSDAYILVVTGDGEESRVVEAFDAGANEYVNKPFNPKLLLARVRAGQRLIELRERVESDKQELNRQNVQMTVLNRKLNTAAMTDVLTDLPNRRYALRRLEEELVVSKAERTPLSVILLDIDHFKPVNDRFGHDIGDLVLRETAAALRGCTRKSEVVCRLGGEEFIVIVPQSTREASAQFAERLRTAVEELHVRAGNFDGRVTVSLGVAGLEDGVDTVDELIKLADTRAYMAKASGRNCVVSTGGGSSQAKSA